MIWSCMYSHAYSTCQAMEIPSVPVSNDLIRHLYVLFTCVYVLIFLQWLDNLGLLANCQLCEGNLVLHIVVTTDILFFSTFG